MKTFVFLTRGGHLCEAHRVCFIDADASQDIASIEGHTVAILKHDAWVVHHPDFADGIPLCFNLKCETIFENLGEL